MKSLVDKRGNFWANLAHLHFIFHSHPTKTESSCCCCWCFILFYFLCKQNQIVVDNMSKELLIVVFFFFHFSKKIQTKQKIGIHKCQTSLHNPNPFFPLFFSFCFFFFLPPFIFTYFDPFPLTTSTIMGSQKNKKQKKKKWNPFYSVSQKWHSLPVI